VQEVGDAAEKGLSIFSQTDKQVVKAFEKIAEHITSKSEAKS
jgi:hypothetical protein